MRDENKKEIIGKKVILREQRKEDAKYFAYWFNQPDVMFKCGFTDLTDEAQEIASIERKTEDSDWYTITDLKGNIVGETGLLRMWPVWHCTDISIMLPDPKNQGQGYGTEAIQMMFELAFDKYEMNRIAIGVVAKNTYALEFYEKVGFRKEGIQEQGYYYDNEYSDFIMMRLLKQEWMAQRK
ncbi:GNAT family N-acetyltransferase [Anaerosporobacter faecicola]|uniref:GNAT family N-acetyltransferase n=1 Tax=Anaerosporobacter faecicola TaxID=2718714 RepID=UPI00143A6174|nr:GNAT family protein [Anaerosporobacter faecicola]